MSLVIQQVVDGLAAGSIYGALALAIVLVYRATGMINFAQGAMAVASAYVAWTLWNMGLTALLAVVLAVAVSVPMGALIERYVMRRFEASGGYSAVVATAALLILITGIVGSIWSYVPRPFPSLFPFATIRIFGVTIGVQSLGTIGVLLIVVVALHILFMKTRFGLGLRAVADNPESSSLSGIPVQRMLMAGWGLAAGLGALSGSLIAPKVYLSPGMMHHILVYALAAAILGGLQSPWGAVVAAWFIGVIENLAGTYVSLIGDDLKIAVPLIAMMVILIARPQGLFGTREAVRV